MIRRNFIQAIATAVAGLVGTLKCARPLKGAEARTSAQASALPAPQLHPAEQGMLDMGFTPAPAPGQIWQRMTDGAIGVITNERTGSLDYGPHRVAWHWLGGRKRGGYAYMSWSDIPVYDLLHMKCWRYLGHISDLDNSVGGGG